MAMLKRGSSISSITVLNNWGKHSDPSIADGTLETVETVPVKKTKNNKAK